MQGHEEPAGELPEGDAEERTPTVPGGGRGVDGADETGPSGPQERTPTVPGWSVRRRLGAGADADGGRSADERGCSVRGCGERRTMGGKECHSPLSPRCVTAVSAPLSALSAGQSAGLRTRSMIRSRHFGEIGER